jgi:hypothetical protein
MSLDIWLTAVRPSIVYEANITHNLGAMAGEAGIYKHLWRPDEVPIKTAGELIEPLRLAIASMEADPQRFEKHDAANLWGTYGQFVPWLKRLLVACEEYPEATVGVSR